MNNDLERAIEKTLREINGGACGGAGAMIELLANNFVRIEEHEKLYRQGLQDAMVSDLKTEIKRHPFPVMTKDASDA